MLLRSPVLTTLRRFYAKSAKIMSTAETNGRQVHQETLRHINPCARIKIESDIYVRVQVANVHEYPDGDVLIAELHGGRNHNNATATMQVHVSDDERQVDVVLAKTGDTSQFHCKLTVPIRASLNIRSKDGVSVRDIFSDEVSVNAVRDITTQEINAGTISLYSDGGHINCIGRLLGQSTAVETKSQGNISVDKLLGGAFSCRSDAGNINTNSCYVSSSKFETNGGKMDLKNVHNNSEIWVHNNGALKMTGVHGNINVHCAGGSVNIQISELFGTSSIMGADLKEASINISDEVDASANLDIHSTTPIKLCDSLAHLSTFLSENKQTLTKMLPQQGENPVLRVKIGDCTLNLGKLSWADSVRATIK